MRLRFNRKWVVGIGAAALVLLSGGSTALAERVRLQAEVSTPVMLFGPRQSAFLKVGLTGVPLEGVRERAPVNVAIVLDRSGSMGREKMEKAREAAIMAIERLGPEDIVSVVAYNHTVQVLIPATKVRNRGEIYRRIRSLYAAGETALFAGVSKGAREVRKFIERNNVNRVILLSDGLANVGPSSPGALGDLGWSLSKEGIAVTTIGLGEGYNEDLMVALARQSDGNHAFAENASDLAEIFSHEFGDVLSVVAQNVRVRIDCGRGVRPVRILGRRAEINGSRVTARLNQIYANQEKYILVEVEIPASRAETELPVARVEASYTDALSRSTLRLNDTALVRFSESAAEVDRYRNRKVTVASVELLANEANKEALRLRDQGRTREAREALDKNVLYLEKQARKYKSRRLDTRARSARRTKKNLKGKEWKKERKRMLDDQFSLEQQMAW